MAQSRQPYGTIPGKDFESGDNASFLGLKIGILTRVDPQHMKGDLKMLQGSEERFEVDLTQAMAGPRSFLGGVPEVNSLVLVGYRRVHKQLFDAVIVAYIPTGNMSGLRFDPFATVDPSEVAPNDQGDSEKLFGPSIRYKRISGQPGDIMGMSSSGAEMLLSSDVRFFNRAGDSIFLRDVDRTLITQSIHTVTSDSAAYTFSGGIRRGAMNLPRDIFQKDGRTLKTEEFRYFGRDEMSAAGVGSSTFADKNGKVLDRINEDTEFPTLTFANGREVFYASANQATNFEDVLSGGSGRAFTERRMEIRHDTDLQQEVLEEIDGFSIDRPRAYIEQVFGTVVGNDAFSTMGQRQYGRVLKPKLFEDFDQTAAPSGFQMEEAARPPSVALDEAMNMAAAYYFAISPPQSASKNKFAVAISKQGKLFANLPGSTVENQATNNISAEIACEGALKMRLGAATPDRTSLHLTTAGGIFLDCGSNAEGQAIVTKFRSSVRTSYQGVPDVDDTARSAEITGNDETFISGNDSQVVNGAYVKKVNGGYSLQASRVNVNGLAGYTGNYGELNILVSGKSQCQYALQYLETIALGGKISTILAGASLQTLLAGAYTTNVVAGATTFLNPAGAYSVTVGTGAISLTTAAGAVTLSTAAGALSLAAAGGAVAITAGLAINLTSPVLISFLSPQVLLGGPAAVLGIARGIPMCPPGTPSLDWITGLPLQGSAMMRSL